MWGDSDGEGERRPDGGRLRWGERRPDEGRLRVSETP